MQETTVLRKCDECFKVRQSPLTLSEFDHFAGWIKVITGENSLGNETVYDFCSKQCAIKFLTEMEEES